jgi:hypothetical protein
VGLYERRQIISDAARRIADLKIAGRDCEQFDDLLSCRSIDIGQDKFKIRFRVSPAAGGPNEPNDASN